MMTEHGRPTRAAGLAAFAALLFTACGAPDAATEGEATAEDEAAPSETAAAADAGLLNPNVAGEGQLTGVDGLGADAVAAILDGRPFLDNLALDAALAGAGLDEAARETVYGSLWVPLNLNAAPEEEILLIPGVGDRMAHEFEEYRPYDGMPRFRREIGKYVDEEEVERLAAYVFVPIDLNTASDAEILAIPGVGDRMLHEFKEYRPYTSMEQFRREIGKYVDDAEVERLARYVTLRDN